MKALLIVLSLASVALWSYIFGSLQPQVVYMDSLTPIYERYNHIKMFEDGSYEAETIDGVAVTGCIDNALCNNE